MNFVLDLSSSSSEKEIMTWYTKCMLQSIRRIANALLFVAVIGLALNTVSVISTSCGSNTENCFASAVWAFVTPDTHYAPDLAVAQSTRAVGEDFKAFSLSHINAVVQVLSLYLLLLAVFILIALECLELYYFRKVFGKKARA